MISLFMREVAEEAKRKSEKAHKRFFQEIWDDIRKQRVLWSEEYNIQ